MDPINSSRFCRSLVRDLTNDAKNLGHDTERLSLAMTYSACYHAGMLRKSGEPYILHPLLVARGVQIMGGQQADVLAAVQHDVVEDCVGVSLADVEIELGADVAARVAPLTKDYRLPTSQLRVSDSFGRLCMAMSQIGRGVGLVKIMDRALARFGDAPAGLCQLVVGGPAIGEELRALSHNHAAFVRRHLHVARTHTRAQLQPEKEAA